MPNGAIVLLKSGVNAGSTGNIASVYQDPDCTIVLGHLGTAAPLGETEGLKGFLLSTFSQGIPVSVLDQVSKGLRCNRQRET